MTSTRALVLILAATVLFMPPLLANDDELVVIDERELDAYWRADQTELDIFQLTGEGPSVYGCAAVPFVIEPNGSLGPGQRPLLLRVGQAAGEGGVSEAELYEYAIGTLPRYVPTWDKRPASGIYTSRPAAFMDVDTRERLGPEQARALYLALIQACRIQGLPAWLEQNDDATVRRPLPVDPAQWLSQGAR